jgi:hypothetical protein
MPVSARCDGAGAADESRNLMLTRLATRGVPTVCSACGTTVDVPIPLPRPVPLPAVTDDARWGRLADQHRPGCQWIAARGRPPAAAEPEPVVTRAEISPPRQQGRRR